MAAVADPRPLRVAAVVDDLHPPAWAARVLRELAGRVPWTHAPATPTDRAPSTHDTATPTGPESAPPLPAVLVVVALRRPTATVAPRPRWLRAYDVVDARIAARIADPMAPTDVRALLEGVTIIELAAAQPAHTMPHRPRGPDDSTVSRVSQDTAPSSAPDSSNDVRRPGGPLERHRRHDLDGPGRPPDLHSTDEEAIRRLAGFDLDAIVDLGTAGHAAGLASAARFGVWTLVCGEPRLGLPPATWEVISRVPLTRAQLIADLPGGARRVLYESSSVTDPTSARRNRAHAYAKAAAFVRRTLRDLAADRTALPISTAQAPPAAHLGAPPAADEDDAPPAARSGVTAPPSSVATPPTAAASAPTAATSAVPIAPASQPVTPLQLTRFAGSVLRDRLQRVAWRKQWILAYGIDPTTPAGSDEPARDLSRLARIVPPADRFWADPFVVRHGDGWVILLEERIFARPHAHIAALPVARDGTLGDVVPVLERDYHLSYPFVFAWNGAQWMIPESAHNRTVELWRATDFPRRWTLERVLLTGLEAADATLIEHAGAWWMFCTVAEPDASKDDELHVFHASSPLGPWRPHPRNPVKSTARGARPAGRPFRAGGSWVRPAQDGSRGYGGALVLWRIDQLDETSYRETELRHIAPDWDPALVGLHTINAAAGLTVVDLRIIRRRWRR